MDYRKLNLDHKGQIPTYDALMPIALKIFQQQDCDCRVDDIQHVIRQKYFKLPPNLAELRIKHGDTVIHDRIYFACFRLKSIHFVDSFYPATLRITSKGKRFLANTPNDYKSLYAPLRKLDKITQKAKKRDRKRKKRNAKPKSKVKSKPKTRPALNFPEQINYEVNRYNEGLKSRILKTILDKHDPFFFEHLVVDLLSKMGYKGKHGKGVTTKKTGDHGIDGIINEDPLGTKTVYLQAKCYKPSDKVGRPEIQKFHGAMIHYKTSSGVFITTSKYTQGAREEADDCPDIVIVDGQLLAKLMLEYHVGVQVQNTYQILKIDNDYFD